MFPVGPSLPLSLPPAVNAQALTAVHVPTVAIGRLPIGEVAASIANPEIQNNTRGAAQQRAAAVTSAATQAAASASFSVGLPLPPSMGGLGISSLFLAQIMGQGMNDVGQGIVTDFEQMIAYSSVKYMPSKAAEPPPPGPSDVFAQIIRLNAPPANDVQVRVPVQNTAPKAAGEATANVAAVEATASAPKRATQQEPVARTTNRNPQDAARWSKIGTAVHAYATTFRRNADNLNNERDDQSIVA